MNQLYFGDCLDVLREHIPSESVDLIYLDPPFNSKRDYSVLFKSHKGHESDAQITAFEDTWHWGEQAEREFSEILRSPNTDVAELMRALRSFLGENDMMAYLTMMANRLLELHRTLKSTGSLYLHCDPTASHYLKVLMDGVFGAVQFQNEVVWKRTGSHGGAKRWGPIHDTILFYCKGSLPTWNRTFQSYDSSYTDSFYSQSDDLGRFGLVSLTGAGLRSGDSGKPWRGVDPSAVGRHWALPSYQIAQLLTAEDQKRLTTQEKLDLLDEKGLVYWPPKGSVPRQKRYLSDSEGVPIQDIITDIPPLSSQASERLGYPTQKPTALLERLISASSLQGDLILDPFCGCGTAVEAAHKLGRRWIGIDVTHLAISLIEKRMKDAFGKDITYEVHGTPKDLDGARDLAERDKYQFQWWACSLVGAQPYQGKKKGSDGGIDGLIFFQDEATDVKKIIVSVKGGANVNVDMVRSLIAVIKRENAAIGIFVTLAKPTDPMTKAAVAEGFYESPHHGQFPRLQILTIEGLLNGTERPRYPDMAAGAHTFKKAKKQTVKNTNQEKLEL